MLYSIYPTFAFKKVPTSVFELLRLLSLISIVIVTTGKLMVDLGGNDGGGLCLEIAEENSKRAVDF